MSQCPILENASVVGVELRGEHNLLEELRDQSRQSHQFRFHSREQHEEESEPELIPVPQPSNSRSRSPVPPVVDEPEPPVPTQSLMVGDLLKHVNYLPVFESTGRS